MTSVWARSARVIARRREPRVVRSSSPLQCRTGGVSVKLTMRETYSKRMTQCKAAGARLPSRPTRLGEMASVDEVTDALRDVIDPELGLDFVELGLIYEVAVDGGAVNVTYTLTSPGCPIGPQVAEQIEEFVSELDGVDSVASAMTFSPPWSPELMSDDAKFALGF